MRDVRITQIYEGTNGIQALDLVGRKLAGSRGALYRPFSEEVHGYLTSLPADNEFAAPCARPWISWTARPSGCCRPAPATP